MAVNSSLDVDRRSELPPCSGETSINCISMSSSWIGCLLALKVGGRGFAVSTSSNSSSLKSPISARLLVLGPSLVRALAPWLPGDGPSVPPRLAFSEPLLRPRRLPRSMPFAAPPLLVEADCGLSSAIPPWLLPGSLDLPADAPSSVEFMAALSSLP